MRDYVKVDGKLIREASQKIYLLLNKPREVISSVADPQGRTNVTDLVKVRTKIFPVGRLDYNTEGLILLTNDGEFSRIVTAAGKHMPKVYKVKVRSTPEPSDLDRLREGMRLKKGIKLAPCKIVPSEGKHEQLVRGHSGSGEKQANPGDVRGNRASCCQAAASSDRISYRPRIGCGAIPASNQRRN